MTDSHPTNAQDDSNTDPTTTTTQHQDEQQHRGSLAAQQQQEECVEHAQEEGSQPSLSDIGKISTRVTHGLKGHTRLVSSISFSPDGTKLASASADGAIIIWHVILPPQKDALPHVEFMVKLVDETDGERQEGINDIVWSPDSEYLVSASDDHTMHVWAPAHFSRSTSATTTAPIRKLAGHSHCVYCVRFNPIGTLLISGSFDETVKVWDFLAGKLLRTLPGHSEVVSCLDFSRDGSVIVSGSFDGLIRMWDTTSGQCLKTMVVAQETNAPVTFITFTPNSRYLITCSLDSTVRIWDYRSKEGTVVKSYTGHSNVKYSIPARVLTLPTTTQHEQDKTCSRDLVVMGSEDGCVCIWDLQSRELLSKNKTHQGSLPHMKQNPPTKSSSQVDTAFFETFCVESIIAISIHPTDPSIVAVAGLDRDPSIKICTLSPPPPTAT